MKHIEGLNQDQMTLFPDALDDYISQENPVRFIDAFLDSLYLEQLGFTHAILQETGRPPYHPGDLLKLYLYGYLNHIRSSRQLERESHRTRSKDGRRITRWVYEDLLDEMERRVRGDPEKTCPEHSQRMKLRKRLAEHPFRTIKHHWDQGHFLTRNLPNVRAEIILAYNIKRTIKILGVQKMMEALA